MSDIPEWQPGDLALCIKEQHEGIPTRWEPVVGQIYTVAAYHPAYDDLDLEEDPDKFDPRGAFDPARFRKVTPPKADEFDREVIELMNSEKVS